jgi:hypothetical protein
MNYNNTSPDNNNIIIKPIEKGDIIDEKDTKNNELNSINQNEKNESNKNIFISVESKLEKDNNNIYESLFINELIKYNLLNIFSIIKRKIIILNSKIYYRLKNYSHKKIILLIKSEILYIKISSSIEIISNIFRKKRANILYQTLYILNGGNKINNHIFKIKYEIKFKNEKDNIINESTIKLKKLEKEVNEMENNIKILNLKDSELKIKITNLSKKEKQLNDTIKQIENSKSIISNSNNRNSINNNSMYESDIISLESTIVNNKQQNEEKQKIINNFIFKVNALLNEYQEYIDLLNNNKSTTNNMNLNDNSNSNKQSLSSKDKDESSNTVNSSKNSFKKQQNDIYQERFLNNKK